MRSRLVLGLVLFVSMPTAVSAAVFCVEGAEALPPGDVATLSCFPGADPDSGDLCEPGYHPTIASALDALEVWQASNPLEHNAICMIYRGILEEELVIDNDDNRYGESVMLKFQSGRTSPDPPTSWCPPPGAEAGIRVTAGNVIVNSLVTRRGPLECTGADRPTIAKSEGAGNLVFQYSLLSGEGGSSPVLEVADGAVLDLSESRVSGGQAPMVSGDGQVIVRGSDVSLMEPPVGVPLMDVQGGLDLGGSSVASNSVRGAPMVRVEGLLSMNESVVVGNAVGGNQDLFELIGPVAPTPLHHQIWGNEIARNMLSSTDDLPSPPSDSRGPEGCSGTQCMPCGAGIHSYLGGPLNLTDAQMPGNGALISFRVQDPARYTSVHLLRNFVVENEMGTGAAIVRLEGEPSRTTVTWVHNTIANNGGLVMESGTGIEAGNLVSARNLFVGPAQASMTAPFRFKETTLDSFEVESEGWTSLFAGGIEGPTSPLWGDDMPAPFMSLAKYEVLPDCERVELTCSNISQSQCEDGSSGYVLFCLADAGMGYVPHQAFIEQYAAEWPWLGPLLDTSAGNGDPFNTPGATGWECQFLSGPFDQTDDVFGDPESGDGDGYTTLVDCDNNSLHDNIAPPDPDGYTGPGCEDTECYSCPGSPPWPDDDDDDGTPSDDDTDDDDSGHVIDDDDDDSGGVTEFESCSAKGCGTPFGAAFLPLALLMTGRRRRDDS